MNLVTRDPFFGSLFDDLFEVKKTNTMKSDIYEKDGHYVIEVDVPGFNKDEIKVDYENGYITILAKREEQKEEDGKNYFKRERYYGEQSRSYYIGDVIENDIKAKFEDGILKIVFPKEEPKNTTKLISIE